jgi:glyoxylase-like metal-dependent hydrolase (beta-lactamase superfamily II)
MIPLEDNFNDIIGKAQRGLGFSDERLASLANISAGELSSAKEGHFNAAVVLKLAPTLRLGADALVASGKKSWLPKTQEELSGLACFNTVYHDMTVNSYLAWDAKSGQAVCFDTGADASPMIKFATQHNLRIETILLTHSHPDHIADLESLKRTTKAPAFVCQLEAMEGAESFTAGKAFKLGSLEIATRQTSGHSRGGITFLISGLARPVAVVGDSIYAGSMGGGAVSYADALRNNREQILTLPPETVLCPGHGPLTTVGEEEEHNPFFTGTK